MHINGEEIVQFPVYAHEALLVYGVFIQLSVYDGDVHILEMSF